MPSAPALVGCAWACYVWFKVCGTALHALRNFVTKGDAQIFLHSHGATNTC